MEFNALESKTFHQLLEMALEEDLAPSGLDLTSESVIPETIQGSAVLVARTSGVIAGLHAVAGVFSKVDPTLAFQSHSADGTQVGPGTPLATVKGPMRSILTAERTALNFLQHLSGIASLTRTYVDKIADLPCQLLDTRKTLPGWRVLEKYAVRRGGGHNHRMGLGDGILIKDNHLAALGTRAIEEAVGRARQQFGTRYPIEVEVDTLGQFDRALVVHPDVILLDNMPVAMMREAVGRKQKLAPKILLEASGGVNLTTLRAIAETGVDRISVGALTHSATAMDIALDYGS